MHTRAQLIAAGAALAVLACPATATGVGDGATGGDDVLVGTSGNDTINGLGGDDVIHGYLGADELTGAAGDDQLYGGRGSDLLLGKDGKDFLSGGPRGDSLYGAAGADELRAGAFHDTIVPGDGADVVHAGPGDDELFVFNDGKPDRYYCDGGYDWVEISLRQHQRRDPRDVFIDCEDVYVDRDGGLS